jgi:catechol 2,3-dioxygenase-like lactoylglutathione lyase family enzyme
MIKTTTLNHVAVRVTDVDKAKNFYENVIGLRKLPRPKINIPGEWYGIGDNALHIIGGEPRSEGIDPTGPHMAIEVEDFEGDQGARRGARVALSGWREDGREDDSGGAENGRPSTLDSRSRR